MVNKVFTVLTEFRFEAGSAIATSNQLEGAVNRVSSAADQALINFQRLSIGIVGGFLSGPGGGILGVLTTAVTMSEKFLKAQVGISNALGASGGSFAARMGASGAKIQQLNVKANEFGLPTEQLVEITKMLTPAVRSKGVAPETALDRSAELGRVFLKAAPTLGVDPAIGAEQLRRAVLGLTDVGGPLFDVLTADTKAMAEFAGKAAAFKKLSLPERMDRLQRAFGEFADDMDAVDRLANSISGQMNILKNNLVGLGSVLKPIGDVAAKVAVDVLKLINNVVDGKLRVGFQNLALVMEPFTRDLASLTATFYQLRSLSSDVRGTGNFVLYTGAILGIGHALQFLGIRIPFVSAALGGLMKVAEFFGGPMLGGAIGKFLAGPSAGLLGFFNGLLVFASRIIAPLALITMMLQLFERSMFHVKVAFATTLAGFFDRFAELGLLLGRMMGVFNQGFDTLARLIAVSPAMSALFMILDSGLSVIESVVEKIALAMAAFQGLAFGIMEFINQIKSAMTFKGFSGGKIGEAFNAGTDMMLAELFPKIAAKIDSGEGLMQQTVNMNVKMENNFKEMLEPDRVAFTITDQLLKAARNKTGAAGLGQRTSGVGN